MKTFVKIKFKKVCYGKVNVHCIMHNIVVYRFFSVNRKVYCRLYGIKQKVVKKWKIFNFGIKFVTRKSTIFTKKSESRFALFTPPVNCLTNFETYVDKLPCDVYK